MGKEASSMQLVQHYFHNLILAIIQEEQAKERVSFKYVSFDWLGNPGWYFWPKEKSGVYYLKLIESQSNFDDLLGNFQLFYYPHPDEELFEKFSLIEQMVRLSDLFSKSGVQFTSACPLHSHHHDGHCDHHFQDLREGKGIPTIDAREQLSHYLFRVGSLSLTWKSRKLYFLKINSQKYSQTWFIRDIIHQESEGDSLLARAMEPDRELPTGELVSFFVTKLMQDLGLTWNNDAESEITFPNSFDMAIQIAV